jgi:hypothetical protein
MRLPAAALLCLAFACAAAQQPAAPPGSATVPTSSTITTNSTLVVLPTLVRKASGELVYGLKAADFTVTDDGVPQTLHLEEDSGGEPLALVVLIEADAAARAAGWHPYTALGHGDRFRGVPALVEAMIGAVPHQVAVVGFDSRPELELDFTSDFGTIDDTIYQLDQGNDGDHGAGILDGLIFAVNVLHHAPAGYRRAILLLSETNDRGSMHTLGEAVQAVTESNVAIYSVAFSTPFHEASEYGNHELPTKALPLYEREARKKANAAAGPPTSLNPADMVAARILQGVMFGATLENPYPQAPGGCFTGDPRRNTSTPMVLHDHLTQAFDCLGQLAPPLGLAKLAMIAATDGLKRNIPESVAKLTGGEYFTFNGAKSLEGDLATLANHVPNRYLLSFQPQSPHPGMHVLQVRRNGYPQLDVTARTGYWVDPVAVAAPSITCSAEPQY